MTAQKHTTEPLTRRLRRAGTMAGLVLVTAILLIIEENRHEHDHEPEHVSAVPAVEEHSPSSSEAPAIPEELPVQTTPADSLYFFLDRLGDPAFIETYDDGIIWYRAAEELGFIGLAAIPHLIDRLDTDDAYERTQVFYALRLAAQHDNVRVLTSGEYVDFIPDAFPPPEVHAELAIAWREWYDRYEQLFSAELNGGRSGAQTP